MTLREERKQQTRQSLLQAALKLAGGGRSLASLGLREITREAGVVPTAFYRHFGDMDELMLALVDEVTLTLRRLLREARVTALGSPHFVIQSSVQIFLDFVRANPRAFEILAQERGGANARVREAINREVRFFVGELAEDLRLFPPMGGFPAEDREMIADLVINTALTQAGEILQLPQREKGAQNRREQELTVRIIKQIRLIFLGAAHWQADRGAVVLGEPAVKSG
ncbi:MAG: HTH-type transcriptional repressor FabR [Nevskiales bacterium]